MNRRRPPWSEELVQAFVDTADVFALGVGGSQATGVANAASDVDLYVFSHHPLAIDTRRQLIHRLAGANGNHEIPNPYWGDADYCFIDGRAHDIMYHDQGFFDEIDSVVNQFHAREGYTTAFAHTLATMVPLHDPDRKIATWQEHLRTYPDELARAIIERNWPVLAVTATSYRNQVAKALENNDPVSVNHRITALLTCVFDIAFAVLRQWHPGEKRQLQFLAASADRLPAGFSDHILAVLLRTSPDRMNELKPAMDRLIADVETMIA